jgi:glycine cleavage system regulatory protein
MRVWLVLTLIGDDRPGLVGELSRLLTTHEANWEESRMARLSGKFAGILRASVPEDRAEALSRALGQLESVGLKVVVERSDSADDPALHPFRLELVGHDRPGIIRDVSRALAERGINVEELQTECTSAPMTGDPLFRATARLRVPSAADLDELRAVLERLANDLMVDLALEEE